MARGKSDRREAMREGIFTSYIPKDYLEAAL